ncbi:cytosine/adenosine deaminase [Clostridium sp. CAG:921]|nr:cytosine/adenosine deaminase [Clostridium sp. CAG:921]
MYVTLEPCAMCAGAINQSRISKIFFGARDHKNGCIGSVCNILDENLTVKVKYEYLEETQCSSILSDFFRMLRKNKKNKDLKT